jgi:hypothetical protein
MSSCTNSNTTSTSTTDFLTITIVRFRRPIATTSRRDSTVLTWDWLYNMPTGQAASFDEVFFRFKVVSESQMVARAGEYLWEPFWHGHKVRQYPGLFVPKEGLQSYFSRLIVNSPLSIGSSARGAVLCPWPALPSFSLPLIEFFLLFNCSKSKTLR